MSTDIDPGGTGPEPTKAECEHVLARVSEFLDHELDTATSDQIRHHLSECEPCLDRVDVEQAVKALVRRCCGNDVAPAHLRIRIVEQLTITRHRI